MTRENRLHLLRVVTPCSADWSTMDGTDEVRFCRQCRKNVYNVAAMAPADAIALIERSEGRVCVQLARRSDGTLVTGGCWAALRKARRRGIVALAAALAVVLAGQVWAQAFGWRALVRLLHRPPPPASAPALTRGLSSLPLRDGFPVTAHPDHRAANAAAAAEASETPAQPVTRPTTRRKKQSAHRDKMIHLTVGGLVLPPRNDKTR